MAVLVVGGGVCGVLASQRCAAKGISFRLVDAGEDFGGVWCTLANTHSQLQVGAEPPQSSSHSLAAPVSARTPALRLQEQGYSYGQRSAVSRCAVQSHGAERCRPSRHCIAGTRASRWVTPWQSCPLGQCGTSCGRMLACTACTHARRSAAQCSRCTLTRRQTGQRLCQPQVCARVLSCGVRRCVRCCTSFVQVLGNCEEPRHRRPHVHQRRVFDGRLRPPGQAVHPGGEADAQPGSIPRVLHAGRQGRRARLAGRQQRPARQGTRQRMRLLALPHSGWTGS